MRYVGEAKFRFIGQYEKCTPYIPIARVLLGELLNRDHVIGELEISHLRRTMPDGTKIAVYSNDFLPIIEIEPPLGGEPPVDTPTAILKVAWLPEGIILTPVSGANPEGFGLPTRTAVDAQDGTPAGAIINPEYADEPPADEAETLLTSAYGSDEGVLPQVILNTFKDNKYLDVRGAITGLPEDVLTNLPEVHVRLREDTLTPAVTGSVYSVHWQPIYSPLECPEDPDLDDGWLYWSEEFTDSFSSQVPGLYSVVTTVDGDTTTQSVKFTLAQFADNYYTPNFYEEATEQWYCHRPQEMLYESPMHEGIFQETNVIRAEVERGPMYRQIRGHSNVARMVVQEVALSNKQYHNSEDFRPGYQHRGARVTAGVGMPVIGENLLLATELPPADEDTGRLVARYWASSPGHYATQVSEVWDDEDWPGAEHHASHAGGVTISGSASQPDIDPPIIGTEVCQLFTKHWTWLPTPEQYRETLYGVVGTYGRRQRHGRTKFQSEEANDLYSPPEPYVSFGSTVYYLAEYDVAEVSGVPQFHGVLGCTAYDDGQGISLRAVVLMGPPDRRGFDELDGYATIRVITRSTKLVNVYECDWTVEAEHTFQNSDGWLPYPAPVEFDSTGEKFVFSMQKTTHQYTSALDYNAEDFTADRSPTPSPRSSVQLVFVEYRYVAEDPEIPKDEWVFDFFLDEEPEPEVEIICHTTDAGLNAHTNTYVRTLQTTNRMFAAYDVDDTVIYVTAEVDEYTYQQWVRNGPIGPPSTQSHGWRLRKLIFPSGKEIYYTHQYYQDSDSADPEAVRISEWPKGDGSGESYLRRIEYMDIVTEDIVYHHLDTRAEFLGPAQAWAYVEDVGKQWVSIDLSFNSVDEEGAPLTTRLQQKIWEPEDPDEETIWARHQIQAADEGHVHVDSDNRPNGPNYPNHVKLNQAAGIYNMDQSNQSWWITFDDGLYSYLRLVNPTPYAYFLDPQNAGTPEGYEIRYNRDEPFDAPYGRPPHDNFYASIAPGLSGIAFYDGYVGAGENNYPIVRPSVWGSLQTCNIAPLMSDDWNSFCQIVKYRDRVVIRKRTVRKFYGARSVPNGSDFSDWDTFLDAYADMPAELAVTIYTDFDLDEAVGMEGVTDIHPLGRL
jgi:hypothetical protein